MSNPPKSGDSAGKELLVPADARLARRRFARLVETTDPINVTEVALAIAQEERPQLELARCRENLRELVDSYQEIRLETGPVSARDEARLLCRFLAEEQGYMGNEEEYYDPDNSYLDQVLERRMGIPISLALIYLHVGRGVGLDIQGIGFPGHFLVAVVVDDGRELIDPFTGRLVTDSGLQQLLDRLQQPAVELAERFTQPISGREFVMRVLNNLRAIYQQQADYPRLLACCDRILLLEPHNTHELLQRVTVYQRLNHNALALTELTRLRASATNPAFRLRLEQMMLEMDADQGPIH